MRLPHSHGPAWKDGRMVQQAPRLQLNQCMPVVNLRDFRHSGHNYSHVPPISAKVLDAVGARFKHCLSGKLCAPAASDGGVSGYTTGNTEGGSNRQQGRTAQQHLDLAKYMEKLAWLKWWVPYRCVPYRSSVVVGPRWSNAPFMQGVPMLA